jgi:imidazolonepropionase-like amidohydrolase
MVAANYLRSSLMAGFTTIREAGGADYTIAHLLATGAIIGPRMFYSGKALTQTGGGADFRRPTELTDPCGHVSPLSVMSVIADGVDKVREAAREELRKGAAQLKVFASGGVVFPAEGHPTRYEYSSAELVAIVEEAAARGTYVMAHAYTDDAVRRCLDAGVRSIEHGNFMSRETMARIAEAGAFYDPTFISLAQRIETSSETNIPVSIVDNLKRTIDRGKQVYAWAKDLGVSIALGTDLWGPEAQKSQPRELEQRAELDSPVNILRSATVVNAELLMQRGMLGTLAPGAYADLLIVDGNPLSDIRLLAKPEQTLKLVMKGGVIYKNELAAA